MSDDKLMIVEHDGIHHATLLPGQISEAGFIESLVELASRTHRIRLIVDFTNVTYVSSAVIGKCVKLHHAVEAASGRIALVNVTGDIAHVFRITRLDESLNLMKDVAAVRAEWA